MTVTRFTSDELELPPPDAAEATVRADLVFQEVDHAGPSFEARVYANNSKATARTGHGHASYIGSFYVLGHGGCFGERGHCDPEEGFNDVFDLRPDHQITPQTKIVRATDTIRKLLQAGETTFTVTVVAVATGSTNRVLEFEGLRLLTYQR
jgi:hypothetical protein